MNDPTKAGGDCCHPAKQVDAAPAPVHDCCHAPAVPEPVAPATHDCCHAATAAPVARVARPGESLYFCPMRPGVESPVPGTCPRCGMALESGDPGGDGG